MRDLEAFLAGAYVEEAVLDLRPDYRALLVAVDGLVPGPGDEQTEALLASAEASVRALGDQPVEELPHIAAWRAAYRAFGAKPQRTRNSLEALTRRAASEDGLPRVNRLTDVYNAVSVLHQVPLGGEDLGSTPARRGLSGRPDRSRSTPSRAARRWSSTLRSARSCGATRPA